MEQTRNISASTNKYAVNSYDVSTVLAWIRSGEIAIPEIQRPFVWDSTKVRDLMDSLYQGYPIGYLIAWKNPEVRLKDGSLSEGKKVLIDGQQRVTALTAALLGQKVVTSEYKTVPIRIAFQPVEERFEVQNPAILRDGAWIPDVATVVTGGAKISKLVREYATRNPKADEDAVETALENLRSIIYKPIGFVELSHDLDIETVTEIFIRINSKGVVLSQADFAMSKIASNEKYGGPALRKCIDYFCHLSVAPEFYTHIQDNDPDFAGTDYFKKMAWLRNENGDLYSPEYTDLLRVAFTTSFSRGRLSDLVSLLSGRNFVTRTYEDDIARDAFRRLESGVLQFINETNFQRFVMIVSSAGFVASHLIRSQNVLNFAYIVYLKLREKSEPSGDIERYVRKWLVLSLLTGRYASSPETQFDYDVRAISERPFAEFLADVEDAQLSDAFWRAELVQRMQTTSLNAPYYNVFLASQVFFKDRGFLSKAITVDKLIAHRGDIHHVFPKQYLKKAGMTRGSYNQIANYVYMQSETNIEIGAKAPGEYFRTVLEQCRKGQAVYGGITDEEELRENMRMHCLPDSTVDGTVESFRAFLEERRLLMAEKMRRYYNSL